MKRILPAFVIALLVHLTVLKMDPDWFLPQDRIVPFTPVTTMRLLERSPATLPAITPLPSPPTPLLPEPKPAPKKPAVRKTIAKPQPPPKKMKPVKPKLKPTPKPAPLPPKPLQAAVAQPPEPLPQLQPESEPPPQPVANQDNESDPALLPEAPASPPSSDEPLESQASSDASADVVLARPRYSQNPPPNYPTIARKRKYQGTVVLDVFVKENGRVGDLRVADSSTYSLLDRAAMKAVRRWQFEPAYHGDHPVAMWVKVPIRFHLE